MSGEAAPPPDLPPEPPVDPTSLRVGSRLADRYELEAPIATGGMARVWRAKDLVLGRAVAVKVLHAHLATDRGFLLRFRREAVAAARLSHRSIVAIYDTVSDAGLEAIVMELIEGRTLRALLDEAGSVDAGDAIEIGAQISEALAVAHTAGVVHRDIKPSNILLCADRRVMVTDFGIAKAGEDTDLTVTGTLLGTAKYLSPEQVAGDAVDPRSDLYSLGVVLYEALAGVPPFVADTDAATALARLHTAPPSLADARPDLHPGLVEVIDRLLARTPSERFQRALDARAALSVAGKSVGGRPGGAAPAASPATASSSVSIGGAGDPTIVVGEWGQVPRPQGADSTPTGRAADAPLLATLDDHVHDRSRHDRDPDHDRVPDDAWDDPGFLQSERSWLVPALALGLVATALVVAAALFTRPLDGGSAIPSTPVLGDDETTGTTQLTPIDLFGPPVIAMATDFDPFGDDGEERPDDVAFAIDGDDDTFWPTTTYDDVAFAGLKSGVGLILTLADPSQVSEVTVETSTDDFRIEIYIGDGFDGDQTRWGEAIGVIEGNGRERVEVDGRGSHVLLWVTEPGISEDAAGAERNRLQLHEVTLE